MSTRTITYLFMSLIMASCSLFELELFQEPIPEGPFPSSQNYDSVLVIVAWDTLKIEDRMYPSRFSYLVNPSFPSNSVNYVIEALSNLDPQCNTCDSLFVEKAFSKGDTLTISTIVLDTTFYISPKTIRKHVPEYNPEEKLWRVGTHGVWRLHSINGVPLRE